MAEAGARPFSRAIAFYSRRRMTAPAETPPPRPVAASKVEMTEIVFPNDANPLGNCMGGRVMHWIDIAAAVCAGRHARTPVVTANVDNINFVNPVESRAPRPVPPVQPETVDEKRRYEAAQMRRAPRLQARK